MLMESKEKSNEASELETLLEDEEQTREQELEAELATAKDQWMRALAEAENIRKRADREREEMRKYAQAGFARDMLSVADNLRRALESCPLTEAFPEAVHSLISGIEMTERELLTTFERQNIRPLNPIGEKFDPNFHQAMVEVQDSTKEPGTVVQVLQVGYIIHDRLLRPALVSVSKA